MSTIVCHYEPGETAKNSKTDVKTVNEELSSTVLGSEFQIAAAE